MRTLEVSEAEYEVLERFRKSFGVTKRGAVRAAVARLETITKSDARIRALRSSAAQRLTVREAEELALSEVLAHRNRKR